jgi:hypothetical protein
MYISGTIYIILTLQKGGMPGMYVNKTLSLVRTVSLKQNNFMLQCFKILYSTFLFQFVIRNKNNASFLIIFRLIIIMR